MPAVQNMSWDRQADELLGTLLDGQLSIGLRKPVGSTYSWPLQKWLGALRDSLLGNLRMGAGS